MKDQRMSWHSHAHVVETGTFDQINCSRLLVKTQGRVSIYLISPKSPIKKKRLTTRVILFIVPHCLLADSIHNYAKNERCIWAL